MTQPDAAGDSLYPAQPVPGKTMDFTLKREPHTFTIDDDTFFVPQILAVYNLRRVAATIGSLGEFGNLAAGTADPSKIEETLAGLSEIFLALIPGASGERFVARLNSRGLEGDPTPIDLMRQAIPVLFFLLECYGLRPTKASSTAAPSSSDASTQNDGTSSTDGPSQQALTSDDLTPPNSST
jgi:hypothetical protein